MGARTHLARVVDVRLGATRGSDKGILVDDAAARRTAENGAAAASAGEKRELQ